jgi:potassium efflux system protein
MLIPNSEFINKRVINWTLREAKRRMHVPVGVAYGTDKDLVKKAILEAADNVEFTLKGFKNRKPDVWLVGFGDSSLDFELIVWLTDEATKKPGRVHATYCWEIETVLSKYGIAIPVPQRDLHLVSRSFDNEKGAPA